MSYVSCIVQPRKMTRSNDHSSNKAFPSSPIASKRLKTSASIPSPMGVPAQMPPNQPFIAPADPAFQPAIPTTPQNPQSPQNARKRKAPSHPTSPDMPLDYVPTPPEGITPVSANPAATETGSRKKGRTNTPWTPEEEHKLQVMRGENKGWSEIAKVSTNSFNMNSRLAKN